MNQPNQPSSSNSPDGERRAWSAICSCNAPPKTRIFAWRAANNSLPTWDLKHARKMEVVDLCPVCGTEKEDMFHALCRCPNAGNHCLAMADIWPIPNLKNMMNTCLEWLLHDLCKLPDEQRLHLVMLLWRIWYVRNEVVHDKPAPPVQVFVPVLRSYVQSILTIAKETEKDHLKGKSAMLDCAFSVAPAATCELVNPPPGWLRPEEGRMKLNTDGSFISADGTAGSGMILHDHNGNIVFSACRHLYHCNNALESELATIRESLSLSLQWSELPIDIESDCLEAINLLKRGQMDRSANSFMVHEIRILMDQQNSCITHIYHSQNYVSHLLVSFGRTTGRTMVWLGSVPDEVVKLCNSAGTSAT